MRYPQIRYLRTAIFDPRQSQPGGSPIDMLVERILSMRPSSTVACVSVCLFMHWHHILCVCKSGRRNKGQLGPDLPQHTLSSQRRSSFKSSESQVSESADGAADTLRCSSKILKIFTFIFTLFYLMSVFFQSGRWLTERVQTEDWELRAKQCFNSSVVSLFLQVRISMFSMFDVDQKACLLSGP